MEAVEQNGSLPRAGPPPFVGAVQENSRGSADTRDAYDVASDGQAGITLPVNDLRSGDGVPKAFTIEESLDMDPLGQRPSYRPDGSPGVVLTPQPTPTGSSDFYVKLILAIAAYCSVSISVVYFNWWFFTAGFKFPVFISWLQQCIGFVIFFVGAKAAAYMSSWRVVFPPAVFSWDIIKRLVPLSTAFVITIGLSNICLQQVYISTYQVARSLTVLFVVVLSYVALNERQPLSVLLSCALLVAGFIVGSLDPSTLSLGGLLAGALSSFFQALYNVFIKSMLPYVDGNNQMLLFYNVLLSSFLFLPMVIIAEGFQPFREAFGFVAGPNAWVVWGGIAISGILGTTLNMTQYLMIQITTPLTFNIIGFMKSVVQMLGGVVFFGDPVSEESAIGIIMSTIGSACYTKAKHTQSKRRAEEARKEEAARAASVPTFDLSDMSEGTPTRSRPIEAKHHLESAATTPESSAPVFVQPAIFTDQKKFQVQV